MQAVSDLGKSLLLWRQNANGSNISMAYRLFMKPDYLAVFFRFVNYVSAPGNKSGFVKAWHRICFPAGI